MTTQNTNALNPSVISQAPVTGYQVVCYFSSKPSQDTTETLANGTGIDLGVFATYGEAMAARNAYINHPDYVGYFLGEPSQHAQEGANHA